MAGYGEVSAVSYSSMPKGCSTGCYSDYSGYFCGYFNTHPTGSGTGTDTESNEYLHCLSTPRLGTVPDPACTTECGAPGWSNTGAGAAAGTCHKCWSTSLWSDCPSGTHHVNDGITYDDCCNTLSCSIRTSPPVCTLKLLDSYGDGWQGATWSAPGLAETDVRRPCERAA